MAGGAAVVGGGDAGAEDGESGAAGAHWDSRTVVVQARLRRVEGGRESADQCFREAIEVLQALGVWTKPSWSWEAWRRYPGQRVTLLSSAGEKTRIDSVTTRVSGGSLLGGFRGKEAVCHWCCWG